MPGATLFSRWTTCRRRRYFNLPDLNAPAPAEAVAERLLLNAGTRPTSGRRWLGRKIAADRAAKRDGHSSDAGLKSQLFTVLRDQLINDVKRVHSTDAAAIWARQYSPGSRLRLNVADARRWKMRSRRSWQSWRP